MKIKNEKLKASINTDSTEKDSIHDEKGLSYSIERIVAAQGTTKTRWMQARTAVIPGEIPEIVTTIQKTLKEGTHPYHDIYETRSYDMGKTWSEPQVIPNLRRREIENGYEKVIGDLWPKWHAKTRTILGTGKSFFFPPNQSRDNVYLQEVAYCIWDEKTKEWSLPKSVEMPEFDNSGKPLMQPNAGCTQCYDLANGEILLPFRYSRKRSRRYVSAVMLCTFDGKTLSYIEHGSEFTIDRERGLCEPSLAKYDGEYFLTMRSDHSAFVTKGTDGLHFQPMKEWTFDDGTVLGSYNTQQHWVSHSEGLFLVYTRKGADNDHIFRHRAPLFIAEVDPERLCVIRETEKILLPENNACFGNGGVVDVNEYETWVTDAERNKVFIARIIWNKPLDD